MFQNNQEILTRLSSMFLSTDMCSKCNTRGVQGQFQSGEGKILESFASGCTIKWIAIAKQATLQAGGNNSRVKRESADDAHLRKGSRRMAVWQSTFVQPVEYYRLLMPRGHEQQQIKRSLRLMMMTPDSRADMQLNKTSKSYKPVVPETMTQCHQRKASGNGCYGGWIHHGLR